MDLPIDLHPEKLKSLMESFYIFSGIRFLLFDAEYRCLVSYPEKDCAFCTLMKQCPETARRCRASDRRSLRECRRHDGLVLYKCHAGLVEAAMALRVNESIVGYLMFGQISDTADTDERFARLAAYCAACPLPPAETAAAIRALPFKTRREITASADIMEACTSLIILKELITPRNDREITEAKAYIEAHLSEPLTAADLCRELHVSRTRLYALFRQEIGDGVSAYIRRRRMHRAKKLLTTTELPVWQIAEAVGFVNYNYFSEVFRKTYGRSPRSFRS